MSSDIAVHAYHTCHAHAQLNSGQRPPQETGWVIHSDMAPGIGAQALDTTFPEVLTGSDHTARSALDRLASLDLPSTVTRCYLHKVLEDS